MTLVLIDTSSLCDDCRRQVLVPAGCKTVMPVDLMNAMLTRRQRDVLHGIAQGWSNKAIARHLNVSENTVKTHLRGLYRVLQVHTRNQVYLETQRAGLWRNAPLPSADKAHPL